LQTEVKTWSRQNHSRRNRSRQTRHKPEWVKVFGTNL